jgi:putative holliday junction resolvase
MLVIGLDIGTKRIGVAKWSTDSPIVKPVELIAVDRPIKALNRIKHIFESLSANKIVVGYPLMPNGKPGELAHLVHKWTSKLEVTIGCPVVLWDERMTSKQAERDLSLLGIKAKEQKKLVDIAAAMRILESWSLAESFVQKQSN